MTQVSGLPEYIAKAYQYAIWIAAIAATVMAVYGGFRYLLGASYENIARGKEIIIDAIAGMLLIFLAYVILNTINPATVHLQMPPIARIVPCTYNQAQPAQLFEAATQGCATDAQCPNGGKCMRGGYIGSGGANSGDLKVQEDQNQSNTLWGHCSEGKDQELCRCETNGCKVLAANGATYANNNGQGFTDCAGETATPSTARCLLDHPNTAINSTNPAEVNWHCVDASSGFHDPNLALIGRGNGKTDYPVGSCNNNSGCHDHYSTAGLASTLADIWNRVAGGPSPAIETRATNAKCIGVSATAGECSAGEPGGRCRCKGDGCGAANMSIGINCESGLTCQVYSYVTNQHGMNTDWYCGPTPTGGPQTSRVNAPCTHDIDCNRTNGEKCILYRDGSNEGRCSRGDVGQLCNCSGSGCRRTQTGTEIGHADISTGETDTNNGGKGWLPCQGDLRCVYRVGVQSTRGFIRYENYPQNDVWTCQDMHGHPMSEFTLRTPAFTFLEVGAPGRCDLEKHMVENPIFGANTYAPNNGSISSWCQTGGRTTIGNDCVDVCGLNTHLDFGTCVRYNNHDDPHAGECSRGLRGQRCRCTGTGCGVHGDTDVADCAAGLACTLFYGRDESNATDKTTPVYLKDEWFCDTFRGNTDHTQLANETEAPRR